MCDTSIAIAAHRLVKSYQRGRWSRRGGRGRVVRSIIELIGRLRHGPSQIEVPVLLGVDLAVQHGEFVSVMGQSGSGKSTLLQLLGTLDRPDSGEIYLGNHRIDHLPARDADRLRNQVFGFIFQFYHLLPELSTLENVLIPMMVRYRAGDFLRRRKTLRAEATELLARVGLLHRTSHKPCELSGGEMQRAAIARALVGRPQILLADEPTGNLDTATGSEIMDLLVQLNRDEGLTIIMVTHDAANAARADRCVRLVDGRIHGPEPLGDELGAETVCLGSRV
jgi:lipoprotein-releasing system ATP-binding protein